MHYDVLIVGGGPAGLATAIRLKQLGVEKGRDVSVCLIEKGTEIGAHILSGTVFDPRAITELIPDWRTLGAPLETAVSEDRFLILRKSAAWQVPTALLPQCFQNHGNYIVSLGAVVRWLGKQAEELGVEIYPGIAGAQVVYHEDGEYRGAVKGIATGDLGVGRDSQPTSAYQPGMDLLGKYTVFAEGCRGHLGKQLEERFQLRDGVDPQVHGIGIKEPWQVRPERHRKGLVVHTGGWPLPTDTYGGSFLYHYGEDRVAVAYVVGLGYGNPYLSPYEEFQRYKTHPAIRTYFEGGQRIAYGARAIAAGGLQSLPKLVFPGGCFVGDDAGFLNASRIKGGHTAIKSGMLAAESVGAALQAGRAHDELADYPQRFRSSWLYDELHRARNFKPWMGKGLWLSSLMAGMDQTLFRGRAPWTLHHRPDHCKLKKAADCQPIDYPKPDGTLTFDRLTSVAFSNTNHEENEPCHLRLKDDAVALAVNLAVYAGPESHYCPAGVYEYVDSIEPSGQNAKRLQVNAQNCVHCKTCDTKDPTQNIDWLSPQGGEGPIYQNM